MNKTAKVLGSSLLTVAVSASLICGSTFALFTSEAKTNIAITSGKVNVTAEIGEDSLIAYTYDQNENEGADETGKVTVKAEDGKAVFPVTGGTAQFGADGKELTIENFVPGNGVEFDMSVTNNSTVAIKYQMTVVFDGDKALFDALDFSLTGETFQGGALTFVKSGFSATSISNWYDLGADKTGSTIELHAVIDFPIGFDDNTVQDMGGTFSFTVKAVQGNAQTVDPVAADPDEPEKAALNCAEDLVAFRDLVNGGETFESATLTADVDLGNEPWESIRSFKGEFEGNHCTISNLSTNTDGLFSELDQATVKNLTIRGGEIAKKSATVQTGALAGYMSGSAIQNVTIENVTVHGSQSAGIMIGEGFKGAIEGCTLINSSVSGGQYVGGISGNGYATINNCTVDNCRISGYFKVGGIVGQYLEGARTMRSITVKNSTVSVWSTSHQGSFGMVVGFASFDDKTFEDITVEDCTIEVETARKVPLSAGGVVGSYNVAEKTETIAFKNVTVRGFSVRTDTIRRVGGILGGRYLQDGSGWEQNGALTVTFENCSVEIEALEADSFTGVGLFVGEYPQIKNDGYFSAMPGWVPETAPSGDSFTFRFIGENNFYTDHTGLNLPLVGSHDTTGTTVDGTAYAK